MRPTPDIALTAVCSVNRARHCTTNEPKGDGDLRSPGGAERALVSICPYEKAIFGAQIDTVNEPPGRYPECHTDDAVFASAVPVTNCELACTESWDRVSSLLLVGDDIFIYVQHKFLQLKLHNSKY